jgi:hypothetical protein
MHGGRLAVPFGKNTLSIAVLAFGLKTISAEMKCE